jgi:uncharacterized membrane-anchored protein YhcB (DUF1043 family)
MFWTGFAIGILLGATIGMVVAGLLAASRRVDDALMDEAQKSPVSISEAPRPATHLDDYPCS